jgi:hypothetical protein
MRGPIADRMGTSETYRTIQARYRKLRQQVLDQREVVGHE